MYPIKLALIIFIVICSSCECHNKYSKEANQPTTNLADRPFRMAKINLVWEKAQKVDSLIETICLSIACQSFRATNIFR